MGNEIILKKYTNYSNTSVVIEGTAIIGGNTYSTVIDCSNNKNNASGLPIGFFQNTNDHSYSIDSVQFIGTVKIKNAQRLFFNCNKVLSIDLTNLDTSICEDMTDMFGGCNKLISLDVSSSNTENAKTMKSMFKNCDKLKKIDISTFNTSNVTDMSAMFQNCASLEEMILGNIDTSKVENMAEMFSRCDIIANIDLSGLNTENVTDMKNMFEECIELKSLDISNFKTSKVTDMSGMFNFCPSITEINIGNIDTSNVTNFSQMFRSCELLTNIKGLENLNTSSGENFSNMFEGCEALEILNLSNFDTSNALDMTFMFGQCVNLKELNISSFNTENVTSIGLMFGACTSLTKIDFGNFNTSSVTDMMGLFFGCESLTELDLSSFVINDSVPVNYIDDYDPASNMYFFSGCTSLKGITLPKKIGANVDIFLPLDTAVNPNDKWYYYDKNLGKFTEEITKLPESIRTVKDRAILNYVEVDKVSLDKSRVTLKPKDTNVLSATITPQLASVKDVIWSSSDNNVVSVNDKGEITALKAGTATITVTTENNKKTDSCIVTVEDASPKKHTVVINGVEVDAKEYAVGTKVTIDAGSRKGFRFAGWIVSKGIVLENKNSAITTFIMPDSDVTITAKWTKIENEDNTFVITATAGEGGTISTSQYVNVKVGESAGFTFMPNKGYAIEEVIVNGKSIGAVKSYVFKNVLSDQTIHVKFKKASHNNPHTGL